MRKLLISFTIAFAMSCAFMFALPAFAGRVDALESPHEVNFSSLWTILKDSDEDVWSAVFELSFNIGSLESLDITIPDYTNAIQTYEGHDSKFVVMGGTGTIVYADLDDYVSLATGDTIEMTFAGSPSIVTDGVLNEDADIASTNYVYINMMFDIDSEPNYMTVYWFRSMGWAIGTTADYYIFFFDRGVNIGGTVLSDAVLGDNLPTDPTPPAGYDFHGWRTQSGKMFFDSGGFVEEYILTDDDIVVNPSYGTYIPLYSFFLIDATDVEEVPDPAEVSTVAAFIRIPLSEIGLDNEVGYFLIYVIVCALLVLGIVALAHLAWSFVLMAIFIWTVGATWMGIIPFWATAIIGIFCIGFLLKSISGSSEGSLEP